MAKLEYRKQKVALFIASLEGGGAERVWVTLANEFANRGLRVDLVVLRAKGPYREHVSQNVRVVDLNCRRAALAFLAVVRYLRTEKPSAILSALDYINVLVSISRKFSCIRTKLVVSERSTLSTSVSRRKWYVRHGLTILFRYAYLSADETVCVSAGAASDLRQFLGSRTDKIRVIHNPVRVTEIRLLSMASVENPWLAGRREPVIISVGRLSPEKDFDTLLRAFALVRSSREAKLIILGEGKEREALQNLAENLGISRYVMFPGYVSNPFSWISKSSVFVLSSRYEGLPNALLEAMACSVPVVSTDCPNGPREILEGGKWGRLVPVGDPPALRDAICRAIDDGDSRNSLERAQQFDVNIAVDRYLSVLGIE